MKHFVFHMTFIFVLVIINSCGNNDLPPPRSILKDNDSVKFFKEFDFYQFKPINSLNNYHENLPYVEVHYQNGLIKRILMHTKHGILSQLIDNVGGQYIMTTTYKPDPYHNYVIDYFKNGTILTYCYSCYDMMVPLSNFNSIDDSLCWLTSIQISSKYITTKYYYDYLDSIPKYNAMNLDTSFNSLIKLKQLISYGVDSIIETKNKYLVVQTVYPLGNIQSEKRRFVFEYSKDSVYSINWVGYW